MEAILWFKPSFHTFMNPLKSELEEITDEPAEEIAKKRIEINENEVVDLLTTQQIVHVNWDVSLHSFRLYLV